MIAENHSPSPTLSVLRSLSSPILAILIAIAPKCPLCWAAYLSLLGLSGTSLVAFGPWIVPTLALFFTIYLIAITRRAILRRSYLPLVLSTLGFLALLADFYLTIPPLRYLGLLSVLAGSIFNALPARCARNGGTCHCHTN